MFTPSLGVLKAEHDEMFEPKLPQEKIEAIETLGIDAVIKFAVQFEEKFCGEDFEGALLLWEDEDKKRVSEEFTEGPKEVCCVKKNFFVVFVWTFF